MYTIYMYLFINFTQFDCFRGKINDNCDVTTYDNDEEEISTEMEGKGKGKEKRGRKGKWSPDVLDDFVDIITSNEYFKTKLIFCKCKKSTKWGNV